MRGLPKAENIDQYLGRLDEDKRAALQKLRRDIHAAAPGVEECISYQLPAFRYQGRMLVCFGAAANHCSFYPGSILSAFKSEMKDYETSKGTIRFQPDKPLPAVLVRKLVKARIAQSATPERRPSRQRTRRSAKPAARRSGRTPARRR